MPFLAAAGISAGTSILGGLIGGSAASNAAKTVAGADTAAGKGLETLGQNQLNQQETNLQPYQTLGQVGANNLAADLSPGGSLTQQFSFNPASITSNPNYQFVLAQGNQAVQQSAAAQGGLFGGNTLKALDQYSQGLATQTVNDAYSQALSTFQTNFNNTYTPLAAATQTGLQANSQQQNSNTLQANLNEAGAGYYSQGAQATAAGQLGTANAYTNALNGIAGAASAYATSPTSLGATPSTNPITAAGLPSATSFYSQPLPPPPIVNYPTSTPNAVPFYS